MALGTRPELVERLRRLSNARPETWQLQLRRWVVQDEVLPGHPTEPHPQRHQPCVLRPEAERLPVGLAMVEEMPLVSLQDGPCDLHRLRDAALLQPCEEDADMPRAAPHGELCSISVRVRPGRGLC